MTGEWIDHSNYKERLNNIEVRKCKEMVCNREYKTGTDSQ